MNHGDLIQVLGFCEHRLRSKDYENNKPSTSCRSKLPSSSKWSNMSFTLLKEFQEIKSITDMIDLNAAGSTGLLSVNTKKNRYKDIVPYDYNRVTLSKLDGVEGSDYLNASHIAFPTISSTNYIAAQGPTSRTAGDFIRMLWEKNVQIIVCIVSSAEQDTLKCERYWPNNTSEEYQTNDFIIQMINTMCSGPTKAESSFIVRKLRIMRNNVSNNYSHVCGDEQFQDITHYQFYQWKDHSVPSKTSCVLDMLDRIQRDNPFPNNKPIVVHCSAGCGRTGTIIAIDFCLRLLTGNNPMHNFTVLNVAKQLRRQRLAMVQTMQQYRFIYQVIYDFAWAVLCNHFEFLPLLKKVISKRAFYNDSPNHPVSNPSQDNTVPRRPRAATVGSNHNNNNNNKNNNNENKNNRNYYRNIFISDLPSTTSATTTSSSKSQRFDSSAATSTLVVNDDFHQPELHTGNRRCDGPSISMDTSLTSSDNTLKSERLSSAACTPRTASSSAQTEPQNLTGQYSSQSYRHLLQQQQQDAYKQIQQLQQQQVQQKRQLAMAGKITSVTGRHRNTETYPFIYRTGSKTVGYRAGRRSTMVSELPNNYQQSWKAMSVPKANQQREPISSACDNAAMILTSDYL